MRTLFALCDLVRATRLSWSNLPEWRCITLEIPRYRIELQIHTLAEPMPAWVELEPRGIWYPDPDDELGIPP